MEVVAVNDRSRFIILSFLICPHHHHDPVTTLLTLTTNIKHHHDHHRHPHRPVPFQSVTVGTRMSLSVLNVVYVAAIIPMLTMVSNLVFAWSLRS